MSMQQKRPSSWRRLGAFLLPLAAAAVIVLAIVELEPALLAWAPAIGVWEQQNLPLIQLVVIPAGLVASGWLVYHQERTHYAVAWDKKGVRLAKLHRYYDAIDAYERAIALKPKFATPWINKGVALTRLRRYDEALVTYKRALRLDPAEPLVWINLADVLSDDLGRYDEAITVCDQTIARGISLGGIWSIRGTALLKLGREAEAQAAFEQALTFPADDYVSWASRGDALWNLKRSDEALEACDQAIALRPDLIKQWRVKAEMLHEMGRDAEALVAERQAEEMER